MDLQLDFVDRMVLPVLTYGREVCGVGSNDALERVHLKYCKYILGLNRSTLNCFIYIEVGRFPVDIAIRCIPLFTTAYTGPRIAVVEMTTGLGI